MQREKGLDSSVEKLNDILLRLCKSTNKEEREEILKELRRIEGNVLRDSKKSFCLWISHQDGVSKLREDL